MTTPLYSAVPAGFITAIAALIASQGTQARVLVDAQPATAATALSPLYMGGATVIDMVATSTDAAAKDLVLWQGSVLTTVGGSTSTATTTTSTATRASGSFITDGWTPGDLLMVFSPFGTAATSGVDGVLGIVTAVAAGTLTVNGTPFSAQTLPTGARLCRVFQIERATVAASAGTNGSTPSVALLNNGQDGSVMRYERKLGPADLIAVGAQAAVSALPAVITVGAQVARY